MSEISDETAVTMVQAGHAAAYEVLVRRYRRRMYAAVRTIVRDHSAAEDVVQDAFIRVYSNIRNVDSRRSVAAYLVTTARNTAISYVRKNSRNVRISEYIPTDEREGPEPRYLRGELRTEVAAALALLPTKYRQVLTLYYYDGRSYDGISRLLRIPVNTVRTHLRRAKKMLEGTVRL